MKIVFFSAHLFSSSKKAGFHKLAEACQELGHDVVFITSPVSFLFNLRKTFGKGSWSDEHTIMFSDIWYKDKFQPKSKVKYSKLPSLVHPIDTRNTLLNEMLIWAYKLTSVKKIEKSLVDANFIIFESCAILFLVDKVRHFAKSAKFIYRVSDDLAMLRLPRQILEEEKRLSASFDLISVPSPKLAKKFSTSNVLVNTHGVEKEIFKKKSLSPFDNSSETHGERTFQSEVNVILLGGAFADFDSFEMMASTRPRWCFHYIGPVTRKFKLNNILCHGVLPFEETITFLQHAQIGLNCRHADPKAAVLSHSLKIMQYAFVGLPIVTPEHIEVGFEGAFYYKIGNKKSMDLALRNALDYKMRPKQNRNKRLILDWREVANDILNASLSAKIDT